MLVAVPPSFSLAAFFVLQVALLFTATFHFSRSLRSLSFIPFRLHSFQPPPVQRLLLIFGSPAVASGLRAVKSCCKITFAKVRIFKSINPCQPLCSTYIGRQRLHSTAFHCRLFWLPPLLRSQVVRINSLKCSGCNPLRSLQPPLRISSRLFNHALAFRLIKSRIPIFLIKQID